MKGQPTGFLAGALAASSLVVLLAVAGIPAPPPVQPATPPDRFERAVSVSAPAVTLAASVALELAPVLAAVQVVMASPPIDFAVDAAPPTRPITLIARPAEPGPAPVPVAQVSRPGLDDILPSARDCRFGGLLDLPSTDWRPATHVIAANHRVAPPARVRSGPACRTIVRPVLGLGSRFEESVVLRVAGSGLFSVAEGSRRPLVRSGLLLPASRSWELGWVRPPVEVDPESVLPGMSLKSSEELRIRVGMHESYPDDEPLLGEGLERPDLSETRAYITALWSW